MKKDYVDKNGNPFSVIEGGVKDVKRYIPIPDEDDEDDGIPAKVGSWRKDPLIQLDKLVKPSKQAEVTVNIFGTEKKIKVSSVISMDDATVFVDNISASMFSGEELMGYYENYDFMVRWDTIALFTNVDLPEDDELSWRLLYETNLYENVVKVINKDFYNMLLKAVEKKTEMLAKVHADVIIPGILFTDFDDDDDDWD